MSANHHMCGIECRVCGTIVYTTAPATTCGECRKIRDRDKEREKYRRKCKPDPDAWIVVKDPDELGGFHKGAVINREEMRQMLLECIAAFTPGTILRNRDGQLFQVVCEDRKFKLVQA